MNIRYLPEYFAGFIGLNSGPGWRDTPLPGYTTILGLLVLGAVLFYGARTMSLRKALAAFMVFGAMAGIPLLIATPTAFPNLGGYHSRYALPLLGTWLLIWLSCAVKKSSLTRGQIVHVRILPERRRRSCDAHDDRPLRPRPPRDSPHGVDRTG